VSPCNPPATAELTQKNVNALWGVSTLHMLSNYFTAAMFQHRAGKRQEGSVPAYCPINTQQV